MMPNAAQFSLRLERQVRPLIARAILRLNLERGARSCLWVSGTLLALSGAYKLISAFGPARILGEPDPVFGITNSQVFILVGLLEAWVVSVLARSPPLHLKLLLVALLSTNFLLYRLGLWWLGIRHPCPCLGNAVAWTRVDAKLLDVIAKVGLGWLLVSSLLLLLLMSCRGRFSPAG